MTLSLEELKRQREQIQKHLDWLDAKIADEERNVACPTREAGAQQKLSAGRPEPTAKQPRPDKTSNGNPEAEQPAADDSAGAGHSNEDTIHNVPTGQDPETAVAEPAIELDAPAATETSQFKSKTAQEIKRAKIGCVVLFIGATALFLFLLFGLPYLL
ncbi:MAG: hypothetical protein GVY36_18060 [Verrucomicrobia bacterium]|jgi:uncharacterized membrane protein|nr:hypothetical protein [Verrucomicrobiota bacterium]